MQKIVWEWEQIDGMTTRVKVIGGWLVRSYVLSNKHGASESMAFLSDRDHQWHPCKPPVEEKLQASKLAADFESPKKS